MFQGVRQGNLFYILEKEQEPKLRVGHVISVSNPQQSFGQPYTSDTFVDITVDVDGQSMEFKKLRSTLSIADSGQVIVSDNKELMSNEVEAMLQSSQQALDKVDYHKSVIKNCNDMLSVLNPRIAKEKERDEDIVSLKGKIGGLEDKVDKILEVLKASK